jgi:GNAT superfamily N-acetyltransferase
VTAIQIRKAAAADVAAMARLLVESADAQGARDSVCVDDTILLREGFGAPRFHALVAEADGLIVGLAIYLFTFSTWTSVNGVHLEDLYVLPEWRRHGVAQALMVRLAEIAVAEGCRRFHWFVLKSNAGARRFYGSLGAGVAEDWSIMQIDPKRLTT